MWVTESGGFNTVAIPDPLSRFSERLKLLLTRTDIESLERLSFAAGETSEQVFIELQSMNLKAEEYRDYRGLALPEDVIIDLPDTGDAFDLFRERLRTFPTRWRLDAAMVLEEGIDVLLMQRHESVGSREQEER